MKKTKEVTLSNPAAEGRDCIDAEKIAEVSEPLPGEEKSFDAESETEKTAEFEKLIQGKFKKQFSEKVKKIISRRLKEVKELKESINNQNMKQAQLLKLLIEENNLLKKDREAQLRRMQSQNHAQKLRKQAEETKNAYPDFNFEEELKKPEFCRLLKAGVSVKSAYEVVNIDGILDKNSREAEKMVVDSIRFKGNRPVENGSEPTSGILLSTNIGKLTKKQRAELAKRAASGERITF